MNNKEPLFSIVTVCYNASQTIERTMNSVLGQTYADFEYVIVDGASKDNTLDLIAAHVDERIVLISEPDRGIYDAMNKGLKRATGTYVWFMNAGDTFYSSTVLQELAEQWGDDVQPDILYGETAITDLSGKIVAMRRLKAPEVLTWKSFRNGMLVCHQSFVAKRMLGEYYDLRYRFSSDVDWCIRSMKKATSICNTHLILSCYLEEGATTSNHKASLKERFHIMCKHYGTPVVLLYHLKFAVRYYWAKWVRGRV